MRLRPETLQTIVDEVAKYGLAPATSKTIVLAVIEWYEDVRKIKMNVATAGKKIGRPRVMSPTIAARAKRLRSKGMSFAAIGAKLGVKGHTVWYELLPADRRASHMKRLRANVDRWRLARETPV